MRLAWPGARAAALAFALGAGVALGQAPLGLWWLSVPFLAAVIWRVSRAPGAAEAAWLGLFAGAGHFALALNWLVEPFLVDPVHYAWMAPFAVVFMCFGLGLFWAAAAAGSTLFVRQRGLAFAVMLGAAELARGYMLTGFPWALPGHIWLDTPVAQVVALVGPSGLTLLTLLAAAGLAQMRPLPGVAALGLLAAMAGYGVVRLALPEPEPRGAVIRLVQPNAAQEMKWDAGRAKLFFDRLLAMTAVKPLPDLTVWPETAVPYLLDPEGVVVGMIAEAGGGRPVVAGIQRVEGARGWNSAVVIQPDATISASYDKHHLVPFGEYIPFGDLAYEWFGLRAFAARVGNGYSAGPGPALIDFGGTLGTALPLICYEAVFPQDLRGTARPDWLLQITNDAWFGTWTGPWQHLAQARLRAIEQGLPLARAANTGVTAMIDARGRITGELEFGTSAFVDLPLPGAMAPTIYAIWGEWPVIVMLGGLMVLMVFRRRRGLA